MGKIHILVVVFCIFCSQQHNSAKKNIEQIKAPADIPIVIPPSPAADHSAYNMYSQEAINRATDLEIRVIKLEGLLKNAVYEKIPQEELQKIDKQLELLKQKKNGEEKLAKQLDQLGALEVALAYNQELLKLTSDQIQKLTNRSKSTKKHELEHQQRQLKAVVDTLTVQTDALRIKIKK